MSLPVRAAQAARKYTSTSVMRRLRKADRISTTTPNRRNPAKKRIRPRRCPDERRSLEEFSTPTFLGKPTDGAQRRSKPTDGHPWAWACATKLAQRRQSSFEFGGQRRFG